MTDFLIGCDPEIFLKKGKEGFSAHGVIEGTKEEPFKVNKGAYQVDGMAVEFNTDPVPLATDAKPSGDFKLFDSNVLAVMEQMKGAVKKFDPDLTFNISSVQEFPDDVFKSSPPEAIELGCNPDFNAYTLEENPRPDGEAVNFRTASGHIHIGWGADIPVDHPDHKEICAGFVKYLDATLGLYMTIIDPESRRRELYGKAGAFRPKPYGVEYRTPSNVWLTNAVRRQAVFEWCRVAVTAARNQYRIKTFSTVDEEYIRSVIDNGIWQTAYSILSYVTREFVFNKFDMLGHVSSEYNARLKPTQVEKSKDALETKKKGESKKTEAEWFANEWKVFKTSTAQVIR